MHVYYFQSVMELLNSQQCIDPESWGSNLTGADIEKRAFYNVEWE